MKCLISSGANYEEQDNLGISVLDLAIDAGNFFAVVELIRSGATQDAERETRFLHGSDAPTHLLNEVASLIEDPSLANDEGWVSARSRAIRTQHAINMIDSENDYSFLLGDNAFLDNVDKEIITEKLRAYAKREPDWSWRINEMISYLSNRP